MVRNLVAVAALAFMTAPSAVLAQGASVPAATVKNYTTADTDIGTLLDDPAAKAVLQKHVPALIEGDRIDMARGLTLRAVQQYAPDRLSDQTLAAVDADLAKLPAKR